MFSSDDGHTALDTTVLEKAASADLSLVLVKRDIGEGNQDIVVHASSNVFGPTITSPVVLGAAGFTLSRNECPHFTGRRCLYKSFDSHERIDLNAMAQTVTDVVIMVREAEQALNRCEWSIFRENLRPINEGHLATQKKILNDTEDDIFRYVLTYITDQHGNDRWVTHFIPKEGPNFSKELSSVIEFLELRHFNGCPESSYKQCFYNTHDNPRARDYTLEGSVSKAHSNFGNLNSHFGKACSILIDTDNLLRKVGLRILTYETHDTTPAVAISADSMAPIGTGAKEKEKEEPKTYSYDVAISYAGEDRELVEELANCLKGHGVQIFYDQFETAELWGKNLYEHLADIYTNKARYCILFVSQYSNKVWPKHERRSAQVRAVSQESEYLLPVRIDDTPVLGLEHVKYLDLRESSPNKVTIEEVCQHMLKKLGKA